MASSDSPNIDSSFSANRTSHKLRTQSMSAASDDSQTAADFISSQLQLEADAREALPYKFDTCTRPLGSLRQLLFACMNCNPPPKNPSDPYTPAAVCYSCSVSCHGEHTLVELFNKRNFVCDCGTSRMPSTSPCSLRLNSTTNLKGGVTSEAPATTNKYNHNFQNRFCGCGCDYDAEQQKGTMFQCLGLGTFAEGGCGEDWWHSACVVGLDPSWHDNQRTPKKKQERSTGGLLDTIAEVASAKVDGEDPDTANDGGTSMGGFLATVGEVAPAVVESRDAYDIGDSASANGDGQDSDDDELPPPPGFPHEDDFEGFICYRCVNANPWIKRYAGTQGFLEPVFKRSAAPSPEVQLEMKADPTELKSAVDIFSSPTSNSKKRKPEDDEEEDPARAKRAREEGFKKPVSNSTDDVKATMCKYEKFPPAPHGTVSLFFKSGFREHLCRCPDCFPKLAKHPQLLEEEDTYEPPVSEEGDDAGGSTVGSGSLLDRGERALTNVDRVRAIEGVMAYNHLKEKLTPFFKEFAESGKAISAEDIKAHFAKMRGDEEAIKEAGEAATGHGNRKEQGGY